MARLFLAAPVRERRREPPRARYIPNAISPVCRRLGTRDHRHETPSESYLPLTTTVSWLAQLSYSLRDRDAWSPLAGSSALHRTKYGISYTLAGQRLGIEEDTDPPMSAVRIEEIWRARQDSNL